MKKILLSVIAVTCCFAGHAMESNVLPLNTSAGDDTTSVMTLEQIIAQESKSKQEKEYAENLYNTWSKNTFLNLIYNTSHKMKSDEFPSTIGVFSNEFKCKWGVGLEWGHTFNFHRRPVGSVLFFGLDYTWMDLNFNMFEEDPVPAKYTSGLDVHNLPWHNKKMTIGYGMSVGPSLTFYPFTSIQNSNANRLRLQLYFHVGYGVQAAIVKEAIVDGSDKNNGYGIGHGLYTSFGANMSWDFVGVGFEVRNDNNIKYKVTDKSYDTGTMKMKEETGRLYLQFRF